MIKENMLNKMNKEADEINKGCLVYYPLSDSSVKFRKEYIGPQGWCKTKCATFQLATKHTIGIGQCFGLNPVLGISEIDTTKLRFSVYSARCIYSIFSIVAQSIFVTFCLVKPLIDTDSSLSTNTSVIFYSSNLMTSVLFFRIATKWPTLGLLISRIEAADPLTDYKLVRRCNMSCLVILSLALLEHILSDISGYAESLDCHPDDSLYESFIVSSFPWIFNYISYDPVVGFICQVINVQCTFNWNFGDIFVIVMSLYLKSRLKQVNDRIMANRRKSMHPSFWRIMREDYTRVTYLVRQVDGVISGVVFISFANNLYFICLQLLHVLTHVPFTVGHGLLSTDGLFEMDWTGSTTFYKISKAWGFPHIFLTIHKIRQKKNIFSKGVKVQPSCNINNEDHRPFHGYEQTVYFIYSFAFLVARSVALSMIAAQVHSASKEPAQALYEVQSETYCIEIQRFLDQIHHDTVALSGLQFFNVKRGLVLSIAGTIITYELVLIQLTGMQPASST